MEVGSDVFELERLRLADGFPMMFERTYIPVLPLRIWKRFTCKETTI